MSGQLLFGPSHVNSQRVKVKTAISLLTGLLAVGAVRPAMARDNAARQNAPAQQTDSTSAVEAAGARPNVIFITIDTLRADHLGCYGDREIETPNIDALAQSGARFARAFTPVPITLPSHTVIFTGAYPMATGMHDFSGNRLPGSTVTLDQVLRDHGYSTGAFIGSAVLDSRFGLNQGFDTYFDHFDFSRLDETNLDLMERRGDLVVDEALAWLKTNPHQPLFLWVHLYDPHYPYTPPEPYSTRYKSRPYDGEIAFADAQLGRLLAFLKEARIYQKSIVILAGDHGEGLGEHREKTHGFFIYNSTLHVPLIVRLPGATPRVVPDEASLADVMPTVLQALNLTIPSSVQGRSLLSLVLGRPAAGASQLYAETYLPLLHFRWSQLRAFRYHDLEYIDAPRPELYDLRTDPKELKNLYSARRADANEIRDRLFSVLRRFTPASGGGTEKEPTDPALLERLRSLGYVAVSAGTFADAAGKALPDPKDRIGVYELFSEAMADGQHGRYDESLRKLHAAEKIEPASTPIGYLMGLDYFRKKDFPQAKQAFERVLGIDPKYGLAVYYLGLSEAELSHFDAAVQDLQKALKLDPTNFSAAFNLGAMYLRQNRVSEALQSFQQALQINPDYAEAHEALGEVYLYLHRPQDAAKELERAVALAPQMRKAHYQLGQAYAAQGRQDEAKREYERARQP